MVDLYTIVQIISWVAIGLIMYLVLATVGFDFGAGMLARFVGKTDQERRAIINVVAPTWDGNQVWLITAGAGIFAIWPRAYAASFSGLYLGMLAVLFGLFLRPVAFEFRSKIKSAKWRSFWDWMLVIGSFIPMLIIGVAVGNLFLGLPFQFQPGSLRFAYGQGAQIAPEAAGFSLIMLLKPYALVTGLFAVVIAIMQGASYCAIRTDGILRKRFNRIKILSSMLFILLFAILGLWLFVIVGYMWQPSSILSSYSDAIYHPLNGQIVTRSVGAWFHNYISYPWMAIAPIIAFIGGFGVMIMTKKNKEIASFIFSLLACLGVIFTFGFTLFPFLMPSSIAASESLTLFNASSSMVSLIGILVVAVIMLPIIFIYTTFVYKKMWQRGDFMNADQVNARDHELY
ncbi:cytochrome d ubiquinol oxidase subunit II [Thiotrichales bacterium 19S3-7]|nr:cytochrome d ubiquinol oxidase subunit II [Thiotrichales bacterium 19S3-7]MCF6802048.1 cytochrome d ubiquinol oxidase subunit II [Thiotrichales bacterium 19S3-11]